MTGEELQNVRAERWRALQPAQPSAERLVAWVGEVGFITVPEMLHWSPQAAEWLETELGALRIVELTQWPGVHRYIPIQLLEFVYAAVGDRHPRQDYKKQAGGQHLSWLAAEVYELLLAAESPLTPTQLRERLGAARTSILSIERALTKLSHTLKVLRLGRADGHGLWRPLVCALPEVPAALGSISLVQAAAALVSRWLDVMVCDIEENIAAFFAPLFSRTRIHTALSGLEAAQQLMLDAVDGRPAWRLRAYEDFR